MTAGDLEIAELSAVIEHVNKLRRCVIPLLGVMQGGEYPRKYRRNMLKPPSAHIAFTRIYKGKLVNVTGLRDFIVCFPLEASRCVRCSLQPCF